MPILSYFPPLCSLAVGTLGISTACGLNLIGHTLLGQDGRGQVTAVYCPQIQANRMREGNGCRLKKDLMTKVDRTQAAIVEFCPIVIALRLVAKLQDFPF